ncbi:hypothetical protein C8Q76DRAFT_704411 [Earliella scabrosa]|nr:hypothetical protein C8Q76DRAFT_704411 [Earliella scabrosa]
MLRGSPALFHSQIADPNIAIPQVPAQFILANGRRSHASRKFPLPGLSKTRRGQCASSSQCHDNARHAAAVRTACAQFLEAPSPIVFQTTVILRPPSATQTPRWLLPSDLAPNPRGVFGTMHRTQERLDHSQLCMLTDRTSIHEVVSGLWARRSRITRIAHAMAVLTTPARPLYAREHGGHWQHPHDSAMVWLMHKQELVPSRHRSTFCGSVCGIGVRFSRSDLQRSTSHPLQYLL